jgi:iron uptake system component EfeO
MATRWARRAKVGAVVRFGAVLGTGIALLLTAGCHGGGTRSEADRPGADAGVAGVEEPEEEGPELTDGPASPSGVRVVDPQVTAAVRSYERYLRAQAAVLPAQARPFTDAVRRGNLAAARKSFAASRAGWQRIQSVSFLLPELDRSIDATVAEFATPADPAWTGWHRLEYLLWTSGSTAGAAPYAIRLDRDLTQLGRAIPRLTITAQVLTTGIERLVEEAISEKLPGTEDRYSRTDLADLAANIEGARAGYAFARPVLMTRDAALGVRLDAGFAAVGRTIAKYRRAGAYRVYPALSPADKSTLQAQLTTLAEGLSDLPSVVR